MNFRRGREVDSTEINLIPMIDVLLVILIFMMVTTTFSQLSELKINLPEAAAEKQDTKPAAINVVVDPVGRYVINGAPVAYSGPDALSIELKRAASGQSEPIVIINADAKATHQSVIHVMEAARLAGMSRITFATQGNK